MHTPTYSVAPMAECVSSFDQRLRLALQRVGEGRLTLKEEQISAIRHVLHTGTSRRLLRRQEKSCPMAWIVNKRTEPTFLRQTLQELAYSRPVFHTAIHALDIFTAYAAVNCSAVQKEFYCVESRIINGNSCDCANNRYQAIFPSPARPAWERG